MQFWSDFIDLSTEVEMWIYFYLKCTAACRISAVILSDPTSKQGQDMSIDKREIVKQPLNVWRKERCYLHNHHFLSISLQELSLCNAHQGPNIFLTLVSGQKALIGICSLS